MRIVALDIATATGIADWSPGQSAPLLDTLHLPSDPGEVGRPCEKLRTKLAEMHAEREITHLFFEANIVPRGKTTIQTVYKLCALCGMAEWFGHRIGAKVRQVEQSSWRKHHLGKGTGDSDEMKSLSKQVARSYGWRISNDHEADAGGVLEYGMACMGIDRPWRDAKLLQASQLWGTAA